MASIRRYRRSYHMLAGPRMRRPVWYVRHVVQPRPIRLATFPMPVEGSTSSPIVKQAAVEGAKLKRKRHPAWKLVRWSFAIAGFVLVAYLGWLVYSFIQLEGAIYKPLPPTPTTDVAEQRAISTANAVQGLDEAAEPAATPDPLGNLPVGRINILVMGTDKRAKDTDRYGRSDTLLLVNLDTLSKTARVMTIPRDLVVDIPGYGRNKVNSAYFFGEYNHLPGGGQALAVRTISKLFDVPIDYYIAINFEGFQKLVDTMGGVDINVPYTIDDLHYPSDDEGDPFGERHVHFDPGWQHLDGKSTLRYARTRHGDSDFMRSKRQLQVIMAMRQEAMSLNLVPTLPSIMSQLGGMLETNIPFDQQMSLAQLAYGIQSSGIITSTIDNRMVTAVTLPDGSEGLRLNWKVAQPMINQFFGWSQGVSIGTPVPSAGARKSGADWVFAPLYATPAPKRVQTPQHTTNISPKRTPTSSPTVKPTSKNSTQVHSNLPARRKTVYRVRR